MSVAFRSHILPEGVRLEVEQRKLLSRKKLSVSEWGALPGEHGTAARVLLAATLREDARESGEAITLTHEAAAALPASIAAIVSLPGLARLSATLSFEGRIDTPDGRIRVRWYDPNTRPVLATRTGAFVSVGEETGRLTPILLALTEAIDAYNATVGQPIETRISLWQPVQEALRHATGIEAKADEYLNSLTIYQAGSFALDVRETNNGPDFVPVLMSRAKAMSLEDNAPAAEDEGDAPAPDLRDETVDALLPPELQKRFVTERFAQASATRDAYVLGRNVFVVLDPDLKTALDVVRRMRAAPLETRRTFVRNPRPAISEALGRQESASIAASLFVETQQYSERVMGLGIWERPALPWLQKKAGQWLPEGIALKLGSRTVALSSEAVEDLVTRVEAAKSQGVDTVVVEGTAHPLAEVEAALATVIPPADQISPSEPVEGEATHEASPLGDTAVDERQVLIIKENLEGVEYEVKAPQRVAAISKGMPTAMMAATKPKPHQHEGFTWLVDAWVSGWPGVLLADDMGLGKTFQALAFLAWVRANKRSPGSAALTPLQRGPVLIVAPTALLNNWVAEAERHLAPGALGDRVDAFGSGLRRLKRPKDEQWSPEDALDIDVLRDADWILTTYETLADNHRAFARVGYSLAVFDEMQKVKDPRTINTHAAKAINADFVLGLTGTPIENRLEDLWCIMDRIAPGYLGDLKSFSEAHSDENPESLKALKSKLDTPSGRRPAAMLRRMKESHIQGLPTKTIVPYPTDMPGPQAEAYAQAVRVAQTGERTHGAMLKAIHALRGISLHPDGGEAVDPYDSKAAAAWINRSARLMRAAEILRTIEKAGEKAIVFIEDRAVQRAFAGIAATLFKLPMEPAIINGEVPGAKRQAIVDRFQAAPPGFDLLVLSPKAAGIGLTITAANHVVHLSRWWNPAVEDQCNDRVYRIGQNKPVTIHLPMAIHPSFQTASFDRTLDQLLTRKRELSRNMLAPPVSDGDVGALFGATIQAS
jgi:superfamily II DNA or RNA helicase